MTKLYAAALLALLVCAPALRAQQAGQGPVVICLREEVAIGKPLIVLADVADLSGDLPTGLAQLPLGNSPWPGHSRQISRVLVKARLVSAGFALESLRFTGSDVCVAALDAVRVEGEEIVAAARDHLESCLPETGLESRIELLRDVPAVEVPAAGGQPELHPALVGSGPPVGTVRVDVDVVRGGRLLRRVPVSLGVKLYEKVVVATRSIGAGEELGQRNTAMASREVTALRGSGVRSPSELHGKVAARPIQPGQALSQRMLRETESPVVIEANQRVFLVVQTETLRVVTLGKALRRARKGEVAAARNLSTGKEVIGVATDDSTIQVLMGGSPDEP